MSTNVSEVGFTKKEQSEALAINTELDKVRTPNNILVQNIIDRGDICEVRKYTTEKDKAFLMTLWEREYPEWAENNGKRISFGKDEGGSYIGFETLPGKILKLDQHDLSKEVLDWTSASSMAKGQGKRLPTGDRRSSSRKSSDIKDDEWLAMIRLMPGTDEKKQTENFRQLANLRPTRYWSSSKDNTEPKPYYTLYTAWVWMISFSKDNDYETKCDRINNEDFHACNQSFVRCIR